ncbi:hypothetical protein TWF696_001104 [Orbilia brochopaga]|uniref:Uncharacterized protein n=1 Tax=Orbilia brochopaga TaxID=3140254 RepID=A0AAV9VEJ0_9PEZI
METQMQFDNGLDWSYWPVVKVLLVAVVAPWLFWAKVISPVHTRRPGYPTRYKPRRESGSDIIGLSCAYGTTGDRFFGEHFHLDFNDPQSLKREIKRFGMAGVAVVPRDFLTELGGTGFPRTTQGFAFAGLGELLLADDDIRTSDLFQRDAYVLAVYPTDVREATFRIDSPALRVLVKPHRIWKKPKSETQGTIEGLSKEDPDGEFKQEEQLQDNK